MVRTSINILEELWDFVVMRINELGNFSLYLQYLLNRYGIQFQNHIQSPNGRILTIYQPDDEHYIIQNIRVRKEIWLCLKGIREQTGFSMCRLIRIMIEWDMQEHNMDRESLMEFDHSIGVIEGEFIVMHKYRLEIRIDFVENQYFWDAVLEYINNHIHR